MYLLIRIGTNDSRFPECVSKTKKNLENTIKKEGYYWSKKVGRYINDKTCRIKGGSGTDYIIEQINIVN